MTEGSRGALTLQTEECGREHEVDESERAGGQNDSGGGRDR